LQSRTFLLQQNRRNLTMEQSLQSNDDILSKNTDFVIKLRLVGVGGTPQIRRVRLPLIAVDGKLSHEELVSLAIRYTFPDAPNKSDNYDVTITYYDEDNDCVTIASTEELYDAISQFSVSQPPVLRLTTDVKLKKITIKKAPNPPQVPSPARRSNSGLSKPQVQLQQMLESVVTALASAAVNIQGHIKSEAANPNMTVSSPSMQTPATLSSGERESSSTSLTSMPAIPKENAFKSSEEERLAKETVQNIAMEEKPAVEDRPFIHGRHTCDGCLCTPIIGTRHHAMNLPDYDLCGKCFGNYKGSEIKFEPAVLDRDRPFQERWHRRRARWVAGRGQCRTRRCHNHRRFEAGPNPSDMDAALKEAIRRSLRDTKARLPSPPTGTIEAPSETSEHKAPSVDTESTKVQEDMPTEDIAESPSVELDHKTPSVEEDIEDTEKATSLDDSFFKMDFEKIHMDVLQKEQSSFVEHESSFSKDAVGSGDVAEAIGQTLDECAKAIDDMVSELAREPSTPRNTDSDSYMTEDEIKTESGVSGCDIHEGAEEEVSVMTNSIPSLVNSAPQTVVDEKKELSENHTKQSEPEDEQIGTAIVKSSNKGVAENQEEEVVDSRATELTQSEDEWEVVDNEDQVEGDEMLARAFQLLGSALYESDMSRSGNVEETTDTVGSGSLVSASAKSVGTEISAASSVPSSVPSIPCSSAHVPVAVIARWSTQLEQLRELGFENEYQCVDVLERLHAANIGVDLMEEVTVTQVVEELVKKQA